MTTMPQSQMPAPGFIGRLSMALFRPVQFFRMLPPLGLNRHWLWVAFLILALVGFSAVEQTKAPAPSADLGGGMPFSDGMSDMPFPMDPGGMPLPGGGSATGGGSNDSWLTALTAVGVMVLQWGALTLLLAEVTLFNGYRPQFSRNAQIAIWSSLPLGLMAGLQLLFQMGGGQIGQVGFTGFLTDWPTYLEADLYGKSLLYGIAANLTLFSLWRLALLYLGGRYALKGKRFAVWVVVLAWIVIQVLFTGYEHYQELEAQNQSGMPSDMGFDEFGFDGMGFDESGFDGMGFDESGFDGMDGMENFEEMPSDFGADTEGDFSESDFNAEAAESLPFDEDAADGDAEPAVPSVEDFTSDAP